MSRHDGKFTAADDAPLDAAELLAALGALAKADAGDRADAIACYLAGGEGWRAALERLGGTFATGAEDSGGSGE